ncbi:MAG: nitrous oxide reductase accessory protein NosL [Elusimicrobia bacterium]|nr:nitrous oxide reductase accessory protein NosL [Elusimicrobiota bacterium]
MNTQTERGFGLLSAALGAALLLAGCSKQKPGDVPRLRLGADACARCGMIVSEERFAAGYVDSSGRSVIYDDLGEFLAEAEKRPEIKAAAFFHDAESGRWIAARGAVVIRVEDYPTPMGSGYAAFSDRAAAERFLAGFKASRRRQ